MRWGLGDAAAGFVLAWVLTVALAPAVYVITGVPVDTNEDLPLRTVALLQVPFDGGMLATAWYAATRKGRGLVRDFGLRVLPRDLVGLPAGILTQWAALVLYLPLFWLDLVSSEDVSRPARDLTNKATTAGGVLLLVLFVVIAAPVIEELFFRGLVLRSLERRMGRGWALVASAAIFGAAHLEPLQFPALFLFGLVAGWLAQRTGRLGPAMWAHLAFNGLAVVTLLG